MSLSGKQLDEITDFLLVLTKETDSILLAGLNEPKNITYKGEVDLVTEYDRRTEEHITQKLMNEFPQFSILAEEGGEKLVSENGPVWIVDPLDGTTNFSHGHPIFATSIGLEVNGKCVLGVISMPALNWTARARKNGGSFLNDKKITVSSRGEIDKSLVATGFPYDRRSVEDDNTAEYRDFMKKAQGIRRCGAAAADMLMVAKGVYDGFWEPRLQAWDLAAGVVLVEEAGGKVTNYNGEDVDIRKGWVVASNSRIHAKMLSIITKTRASFIS